MQTIGFIGSGAVSTSIARLAVQAGYDVVLSNSRGPETLSDLVASLGEAARAATPPEAAAAGDIVVLSIPLGALESVPAEPLHGKVVIDTTNYYPGRDGQIDALDAGEVTASELVQRTLPQSQVVKAFNSIGAAQIFSRATPDGDAARSALPIAGDDAAAKEVVTSLIDALGFDVVDTGALADSWRSEPNTPVYVMPYVAEIPEGLTGEQLGEFFATGPAPAKPADTAVVRELIAAAQRGPAGGQWG